MNKKKRQNHSPEFKAKVAIEALKEQKTLIELGQIYQVHPNQITLWKKEFLENASQVFEKGHKKPKEDIEIARLFEAIGQLKIENDWLKKATVGYQLEEKRAMIDKGYPDLSMVKQCELLSIHRSGLYYKPCDETSFNVELMKVIDKEYTRLPFYGVERMTAHLNGMGHQVNDKRIRRLYHLMALRAIYPQPKTSIADKKHYKYPYLLRDLVINRPNQVWATDITYIPMKHGFMYLVAIVDLYSRFVVGWSISNSLEADFCVELLKTAIKLHGKPEILNSDQGVQFTCKEFIDVLLENEIKISMDGKGRAIDNVFIERLWRSVKYENVYLHAYADGLELYKGLEDYFDFYNNERVHQGLDYKIPGKVYCQAA